MYYWNDKNERANKAREHTKIMQQTYDKQIAKCVQDSCIITTSAPVIKNGLDTKILVTETDSVSAIFTYCQTSMKKNTSAVLNFASYKEPGGMFIKGSCAQEESLCHESFLYNILKTFNESYYEINKKSLNRALYRNKAIYSPNVLFFKNQILPCDVITCAAPNKTTAQKYNNVSDVECRMAMKDRIDFVLNIAMQKNVENLVLGSYGTGVFGHDPKFVAETFKNLLDNKYKGVFKKIIFAVIDKPTCDVFKKVFC